MKVILFTARPGIIIGRKGQEVERLQEELQDLIGRRINIKIEEIGRPEIHGPAGGRGYRRAIGQAGQLPPQMKRAMETTMEAGAKGIKIQLAGRLGGSEMARREKADRRLDSAVDAAGQDRLRLYRSHDAHRDTSASKCGSTKACITRTRPMALMPKRVKHRKSQRGRIKGNATRGNRVVFGDFGLQAMQGGWISAQTIEAGRIAASQYLRNEGRLYIRVFPHKSVTSIPLETRMGKGKGEPEYWAAVVRPGTVLFEIGGRDRKKRRGCVLRGWPTRCRCACGSSAGGRR